MYVYIYLLKKHAFTKKKVFDIFSEKKNLNKWGSNWVCIFFGLQRIVHLYFKAKAKTQSDSNPHIVLLKHIKYIRIEKLLRV